MTGDQFALIIFGVVFVASNVFWAAVSSRLINKLMSRNFYEYKEASVTMPKVTPKVNTHVAIDPMDSMSEFN